MSRFCSLCDSAGTGAVDSPYFYPDVDVPPQALWGFRSARPSPHLSRDFTESLSASTLFLGLPFV